MKYFYRELVLDVPEGVYYPREDSELLAKCVEKTELAGKKALEIGCGSGLLSILMAKKGAHATAADIDPSAVETTKENAASNNVPVHASISDLFSDVSGRFDLIVFNPPYLPAEEGEDDLTYSGGPTGRSTVEKFVAQSGGFLAEGGIILLLISSLTDEVEVLKTIGKSGMKAKIIAKEKVPWEELMVVQISF